MFRQTNRQLDDLRNNVSRASSAIQASFRAIGPIIAAVGFGRLVGEAIEFADELTKASARTGIAVENLQSLRLVAENADVGFDSLTNAINRLQVQLVAADDGSREARTAIAGLGIEVSRFSDLAPDQQFAQVAQAISEIDDPAERSARAIALFGRAGAELLPVLTQTAAELDASTEAMARIGGVVTTDTVAKVDELGDAFGTLQIGVKSAATDLVEDFAPALIVVLEAAQKVIGGLRLLDGEGSNAIVNLDNRIRQLEASRARILASVGGDQTLLGPGFKQDLKEINAELAKLIEQQERLSGTGLGGLRQAQEDRAALEASLGEVEVTARRLPGDSPQDRRIRALNASESRLVQIATLEKDQLIQIEVEKNNELVRLAQERYFRENQIASDAAEFRRQVRETFGVQEIRFEEIKSQSIIQIAGGLFGTLARENSKLAKIQQGIALAEAIWNTAAGITKALKLPYPASLIAAAKVALVGGIQIAKIKATNYNAGSVSSGSAPSVSGGGSGANESVSTAQPEPVGATQAGQIVNITFNGPVSDRDAFIAIIKDYADADGIVFNGNSAQAAEIRGS
jgi:hypothetical protein